MLEKYLARDLLFRRFVGLSISSPLPDHSTIWRFRKLLQQRDLWLELLDDTFAKVIFSPPELLAATHL